MYTKFSPHIHIYPFIPNYVRNTNLKVNKQIGPILARVPRFLSTVYLHMDVYRFLRKYSSHIIKLKFDVGPGLYFDMPHLLPQTILGLGGCWNFKIKRCQTIQQSTILDGVHCSHEARKTARKKLTEINT